MIGTRALLAGLMMLAASPVAAQSGAMWVDDYGRMTTYMFSGGASSGPNAEARDNAELATLFKRVCVDSGVTAPGVDSAARTAGLTPAPQTIDGGKKASPLTLELWTGPGLVVSRTDGFLGSKTRQCNATFYLPTPPARAEVAAAMAAALGQQPGNAAKAVKKDGKPDKYWTPEWRVAAADGTAWIVTANQSSGSNDMPGNRVQLSIRADKPGKRG